MAARLAKEDFNITGIDIIPEKVDLVNKGERPIEGEEPRLLIVAREIHLDQIKKVMRTSIIVDGRNVFNKKECLSKGFIYHYVGK